MLSKAKAPPKKRAGLKTTGEVEGIDFVTPPPKLKDNRTYNINMSDGWICVRYTTGPRDYVMAEFHVNGTLPVGSYRMAFSEDGQTVTFKRAIHKFLYNKEHLRAIMRDGEYSDTHTLVAAVDDNAQRMRSDKIDESGDFFWGTPQVINLKVKCTGTPEFGYKEYPTGHVVRGKHKQFNCVCTCKVQVAEQRTSTVFGVARGVVDMFGLPSSQSSNDSPPHCPYKRSHIESSPEI